MWKALHIDSASFSLAVLFPAKTHTCAGSDRRLFILLHAWERQCNLFVFWHGIPLLGCCTKIIMALTTFTTPGTQYRFFCLMHLPTTIKSSGCLGCYHKPTLITIVDEKAKGPNVKCETVKKPSISEEFWTTSTCDMDNSAVQSQGSISSINLANQTLDQHGGSSSINNVSEFVNHGLLLWNQTRHCWVGNKSSGNQELLPQEPKLK
ncbi:hypothetical protein OIU84_022948 [Salix udensis]|uniref:Gag1-like clamp domain-containing protein n=1 Tax=Salix udensis TaxID=889485 RepID=A0AAD6PFS9_9ROSI|nr:hypothetical protein OIU84_022948 [Salix udensis]KAJ6427450.1 hypothetical protein OIU84_022948 [Salix udensis]